MKKEELMAPTGASSTEPLKPCHVCGQPKLPRDATAWVLGQCYSGVGFLDAYNEGSADCYRIGYELQLARVAQLEQSLRNIAEAQSWRNLIP